MSAHPDPIYHANSGTQQGVSWLARKALALAPASFAMKQYQDENKKTHLETTISVATMTQSNDRVLDWVPIIDKDAPLGPIEGKSGGLPRLY